MNTQQITIDPQVSAGAKQRRRPRLMFVLGLAPTKIGGIERFLHYFVAGLDAAGWDTVLCFDGEISDDFREYIAAPSVTIEQLAGQGNLGFACAGTLWKLLRKYKPEVFVYAFNGVLRCFPWLAKMAGCKRVFFNDHSSRPAGQTAARFSLPKRIVGRILTAPIAAIVSVSDFTRRTSSALGITSAKNVVVSNGVEVAEISRERRASFRNRYGISPDDLVITQVCWMVPEKGVAEMLRAASILLRDRAGVRFLLVGEGAKLESYKSLAAELGIDAAVIFTGMLSSPTTVGVFDATDIYCQPSVWQEACPLAVLEAMSVKLPVVASNTGGLPEIVADGSTGLLVQVQDSEGLAAAFERLVDDADLRRSLGEAGYQSVYDRHRIADTASRYVDIFVR